jgi:hypothetical protein
MLKRILLSTILLAAAPLAAYADNFDYTYVEGAYTSVSPQHGDTTSLTGATVDGSYALNPSWHAFAGFDHVSCCDASENDLAAGAGWNTDIADNIGLFIDGEFLNQNHSGSGNNTGWGAIGGLRAQLAVPFELDGFVSHTDINSTTENTIGVRALYSIDKFWHIFASYANNSDANTFMVGVRYVF